MTLATTLRPAATMARFAVAIGLTVAAAFSFVADASAHEVKAGGLVLDHPWTRATPTGAKMAGGFVVIRNEGAEPDRLIGGSADFSAKVEIHEMSMEGDVMKMRELETGLDLPAGGEVVLKPGSYHVMFIGLKEPLKEGETRKGTLVFEKAGTVEVEWAVDAVGAKEPTHQGHMN